MAFEVPEQIKPVWDFGVQVVLGAVGFIVVFLAAVGIAAVVKTAEGTGFVPRWVVIGAEYGEMVLFAVDLFCFALFLLSEVLKLIRGLWNEWRV